MSDQLLKDTFKKAGYESEKNSVNGKAEFISEYILENFKYSISSKSIIRYYKGESIPNQELKNCLCQFLGYDNYEKYLIWNSSIKTEVIISDSEKSTKNSPKKIITIFLILISLIGISAYVGFKNGEEKCMLWDNNRYVETSCLGEKFEQKLNIHLLHNFRKIKVTNTSTFFRNGEVQVWYDKSNNELEYFTAPGIHPTNGKTLKPITKYIIEKYIQE